uniref:Glutaredoxin n=1 Tax=Rhizophora mucronata TaxID=61149 RepID=A0A2P2J0X6_RHIMU
MATDKVSQLISSNAVQVFTKPYCGFCRRVRQLLKELRAEFKTYDLEWEPDGREMQKALAELTGRSTVPNVFIGGKNVGGCDEITSLHEAGKLVPMLTESGALPEVVAEAQGLPISA